MTTRKTTGSAAIPLKGLRLSQTTAQTERRQRFDKAKLVELGDSIKAHGLIQPILVRPKGKTQYEVVAGERRVLASKLAGLETIDATIRELTDDQVIEVQLIENLQRTDVHPMEEAEGYRELISHGHPIAELHTRIGKSRTYVYSRMKLLDLCDKARKAFYDDRISASVAELVARIPPVGKLQERAIDIFAARDGDAPMSFRRARDIVHRDFMLQLGNAPFDRKDPELIPSAGACAACPKRSGNQPELFGDVSNADTCTDPVCFRAKTQASSKRLAAEARARGLKVITGAAAKKVAPHGVGYDVEGYIRSDATIYNDPKHRTVKAIVGSDAEVVLIEDTGTHELVECYPRKLVDNAVRLARRQSGKASTPAREAERTQKLERKVRLAVYRELRKELGRPDLREVAALLVDRLWNDNERVLCQIRELAPPKYGNTNGLNYTKALHDELKGLSARAILGFLTDCLYVGEVNNGPGYGRKSRIMPEAKRVGIDIAAIRKDLAPKKRPAKKKSGKRAPAPKKVRTKRRV